MPESAVRGFLPLNLRLRTPLSLHRGRKRFPLKLISAWIALAIVSTGCVVAIHAFFAGTAPVGCVINDVVLEVPETLRIEVTGDHYHWELRYPGPDGELATDDDVQAVRNIHVPLGANVVLVLKSVDYVYVLALPEFGLKEIAVPTLEFRMSFHPSVIGQFLLEGDELCGDPHPELRGHFIVESREQFLAWLRAQPKKLRADPQQ